MATILKTVVRQTPRVLSRYGKLRSRLTSVAFISTSDKKKDSHAIGSEVVGDVKKFENWNTEENWVTYGYSSTDPKADTFYAKLVLNGAVAAIMWTAFIILYKPDISYLQRSQREAYVELDRRRKLGLPAVDRNLVDPATIVLPTDEELGPDFEVII